MLFNIHTQQWDDDLLELFDIPRAILPEVKASSEVYCDTATTLFSTKIPISGIAGDQQAALFGQLCVEQGMSKTTYGTGCFVMMNTGDRPVFSQNGMLTTIAWKIGEQVTYALEGAFSSAGPRFNGCATAWKSSARRTRPRNWHCRSPTATESISFRP
ncbi:MAG: FGGY family carbohydrate kinase [Alistipes sp.]